MKRIAIIPVAGTGTHLRPHTHTQPKPLIPIAGKPILAHLVDGWQAQGVTEFVFVIGYLGNKIKDYIEETYAGKLTYHFVVQEPRQGIGHAIWLCRAFLESADDVIITLGDAIIETNFDAFLSAPHSVVCVQEVDQPQSFGVATVDEVGAVTHLAEKPNIPTSNQALVGLYRITVPQRLMDSLAYIVDNDICSKGNFSLTDALQHMVQNGLPLFAQTVHFWHDCGQKDSLLATNRLLLERSHKHVAYQLNGSVIIPPVYIAPSAVIENSIIGPHAAIDAHAVIRNSIVEDSILGAYSRLDSIVLKGSIIGNDASVTGPWHSIHIGDNTELNLRN